MTLYIHTGSLYLYLDPCWWWPQMWPKIRLKNNPWFGNPSLVSRAPDWYLRHVWGLMGGPCPSCTRERAGQMLRWIVFHLKHRPAGRCGRLKSRGNLPGCRQTLERAANSPGTWSWSSCSRPDTAVRTPSGDTSGKHLNIFVADTDHTGNIGNSSISWELWHWQPPEQPLLVGGLDGHQEERQQDNLRNHFHYI